MLRQELLQAEQDSTPLLEKIAACHSSSAVNLIHYLALRRHDMRPLQFKLAAIGLSSLGRAESHVLSTLDAVSMLLCDALGAAASEALPEFETVPLNGAAILVENTSQLLGQPPVNRWVRIMATLSTEAAGNYQLVKEMLRKGVDCVRINCAHDGPDIWSRMMHSIRLASQEMGRECHILMDLAGPKLRTGLLAPSSNVRFLPNRNVRWWLNSPLLKTEAP
ncbi:MAG: pyruvate kinase [Nitrosomonas halophila]